MRPPTNAVASRKRAAALLISLALCAAAASMLFPLARTVAGETTNARPRKVSDGGGNDATTKATVARKHERAGLYRRDRLLVHLHFHKAGGTSMLQFFRLLKLRRRRIRRDGDGRPDLPTMNKSVDGHFVSMEREFLTPTRFEEVARLGRVQFVAVVRDPWRRFRSTYEKELYLACGRRKRREVTDEQQRRECAAENALDEWMREGNLRHQFPRGGAWGGTLAPNYYVRMLNGMNAEKDLINLTKAHLERAKSVLRRFDLVLLLENIDNTTNKLDAYFDTTFEYPHESNNHLKNWTTYDIIVHEANKCRGGFERQNVLDRRLYDWAKGYVNGREGWHVVA